MVSGIRESIRLGEADFGITQNYPGPTNKDTMKNLKLRALVKDAMFYRFIMVKSNGWIEPLDNSIRLGKVPSEVVEYLKNPENDEVLKS